MYHVLRNVNTHCCSMYTAYDCSCTLQVGGDDIDAILVDTDPNSCLLALINDRCVEIGGHERGYGNPGRQHMGRGLRGHASCGRGAGRQQRQPVWGRTNAEPGGDAGGNA